MEANIQWSRVICRQDGNYLGWPTIASCSNGELLVVFSGDREEHACPYGKTHMIRSSDQGLSWSKPEIINNSPLDDRDAGLSVLESGTMIVSWFTAPWGAAIKGASEQKLYPEKQIDAWTRHYQKVSKSDAQSCLGNWTRRSTDGGQTWGTPVNSIASTPHGPKQLADGRMLYVGIDDVYSAEPKLISVESVDEGKSWKQIGTMPIPEFHQAIQYCEPNAVQSTDGKIICLWRHQPDETADSIIFGPADENRFMWQTESSDGGHTWTLTHPTKLLGYPPHLLRLSGGEILATYGRRLTPMGIRACLSLGNGDYWDVENEFILRDDAPELDLGWPPGWDLGYPATIELDTGEFMTVYYQIEPPDHKPSIKATRWSVH